MNNTMKVCKICDKELIGKQRNLCSDECSKENKRRHQSDWIKKNPDKVIMAILVILLLVMTFMGSPIDRKKSEIKKLHEQNDSLVSEITKKDKKLIVLEKGMKDLNESEIVLINKVNDLTKTINKLENDKTKTKTTMHNLNSDGVVDFFSNHLNTK